MMLQMKDSGRIVKAGKFDLDNRSKYDFRNRIQNPYYFQEVRLERPILAVEVQKSNFDSEGKNGF